MTAASTLQISILSPFDRPGAQTWTHDKAHAPLLEHAARFGNPKPVTIYQSHLGDTGKFLSLLNTGSIFVIGTLADLIARPSEVAIIDRLLSKGIRIYICDQAAFLNDSVVALKAAAAAWAHVEKRADKLEDEVIALSAKHQRQLADIASSAIANFLTANLLSATMASVRAAIDEVQDEQPELATNTIAS